MTETENTTPAAVRIDIVPPTTGRIYTILLDGEPIGRSPTPFYDGARLLHARGLRGRFEMWGPTPRGVACRMFGDIETCSKLRVTELEHGVVVERWRPSPSHDGGSPDVEPGAV